jgi:tetratricopeptide (TPR) repeat protein
MKKQLLFLSALLVAGLSIQAQNTYMQKMGETLGQFGRCQTKADFQAVANSFHTIAEVESQDWLPLYYEADSYIIMGFLNDVPGDEKDTYLDQALSILEKAEALAPEESEIYALLALCHTARMVIDPASRAMTYQLMISDMILKSLDLDPSNPRAKYIRLSNDIGTAQFFGQDTSPYCEDAQDILDTWEDYTLRSPIHPSWGRFQVEDILAGCGS